MIDDERGSWEKRAAATGSSLSGVLFKGLPESVNQALHRWHIGLMETHLLPRLELGSTLLDLGCGYGRLSQGVHQLRPDLQLIGVDFAETYCHGYRQHVQSPAICARLDYLPVREQSVSAVLCCVALMYAPIEERQAWINQISRALKPGGWLLLIEPGQRFKSLNNLLGFNSAHSGSAFLPAQLTRQLQQGSLDVIKGGGAPALTLCLPMLLLMAKKLRDESPMFSAIETFDKHLGSLGLLSLQHWRLAQRRGGTPS